MSKFSNVSLIVAAGILVSAVWLLLTPMHASAARPTQTFTGGYNCTYVVHPGDTMYRLGVRFGISPFSLAVANHIANINYIFVGMVLRVPCSNVPSTPTPPNNCGVYVVQRGDWLAGIAARYGVSWQALAQANHIANPSFIYPGMHLVIPCGGGTPARSIVLLQPFPNQAVCSPLRVSGQVSVTPFEATLTGRVYNQLGQVIGSGPVMVSGELGKPGTFNSQLVFDTSHAGGFGRVEIAELSAKDGSVVVNAVTPLRFVCP